MNAIILSIGDELVLGQTVDTNSAWLSQRLAAIGIGIAGHITVSDDQAAIERGIREAAETADVLIISGGLGPTEDDLTRQALAAVLNAPLELDDGWLQRLRAFFAQRGRPMPEANRIQAMIPRGARLIENTAGTAPGIYAELDRDSASSAQHPGGRCRLPVAGGQAGLRAENEPKDESAAGSTESVPLDPAAAASLGAGRSTAQASPCRIFALPGVPKEMKIMFERDVLPVLRELGGGGVILSRTLHTFGLGESNVAELLGPLMQRGRNPSVGTTVSQGIVSLRINARFDSPDLAERELAATEAACRAILGDLVFGADGEQLAEVVGRMLQQRRQTVATAESCTGGLLAKLLTDTAGSSEWFGFGWITYANAAKVAQLGVPEAVLAEHGAVSEPVVRAMAEGARRLAQSDYALAVSGIAGPGGGTPDKPVGMVCIALASAEGTSARTFHFSGDREMVRDRSAKMALTMLRYHLLGQRLPG